jgi:hypothetical protein
MRRVMRSVTQASAPDLIRGLARVGAKASMAVFASGTRA